MSRFVVPRRAEGLAAGAGEPADGLVGRIVKYVPAEITAIFTLVISGLASATINPNIAPEVGLGLIVVFFIGTIVYMGVRAPAGSSRTAHMIVSPLAFLAWAYPISSTLLGAWFIGWVSFIVQGVVLLIAAIYAPED